MRTDCPDESRRRSGIGGSVAAQRPAVCRVLFHRDGAGCVGSGPGSDDRVRAPIRNRMAMAATTSRFCSWTQQQCSRLPGVYGLRQPGAAFGNKKFEMDNDPAPGTTIWAVWVGCLSIRTQATWSWSKKVQDARSTTRAGHCALSRTTTAAAKIALGTWVPDNCSLPRRIRTTPSSGDTGRRTTA